MIDTFNRTGPLMEAASYPAWGQQPIKDCTESMRRVVEHELYQRMRDNKGRPAGAPRPARWATRRWVRPPP